MDNLAIYILDLGLQDYSKALEWQHFYHKQCLDGTMDGALLVVEHPKVLTLGKNAKSEHILVDHSYLEEHKISLVRTDRGGQVTAHMPGQLVVYPILNLGMMQLNSRQYVHLLEHVILDILHDFGIRGERNAHHPGVWLGHCKIAAIGVRIKKRVTMHGFALNISNNLSLYSKIIPCGLTESGVTSMETLLGKRLERSNILTSLKSSFTKRFNVRFMGSPAGEGLLQSDSELRMISL